MKQKYKMKWSMLIFLAVCLVFVPAACWVFYNQRVSLEEEFNHMVADNLTSYTRAQKSYMDSSITDVKNTLEGISGLISNTGLPEADGWLDSYLEELSRKNEVYRIEYRSLDQLRETLTDRQASEQTWQLVERLEKGLGVVSDIRDSEYQEYTYAFTVAEPIMEEGQAAGVLRTRLDPMDIVGRVPEASAFKRSSTLIIREDGTILACNNQGYKNTSTDNLFTSMEAAGIPAQTVMELRERFRREQADSTRFYGKDSEYYFSWDTLVYNDWHLVNFVRSPDVVIHYDNILKGIILASLFLIFLAVALGGGIVVLVLRHRQSLDLEEKKYGILEEFSDTALFIYDTKRDTLEFTSNARKILMLDHLKIDRAMDEKNRSELFQAEDRRIMEGMLECRSQSGENEIQYTELRLKSISGDYHWFGCHYKAVTSVSGAVVKVVGKLADISRQRIREQALREQAMRDVLTDTYNKAGEKMISRLLEEGRSGLFLMLDLDDFKGVNDTKGHAAGDAILVEVGTVLKRVCREDDIVARVGGDEFVMFLPGPFDREGADRKVREIQERLLEVRIDTWEIQGIGASIGAALCPEDGVEYEELYMAADQAMYSAKDQSRNRSVREEDSNIQ